MLISSIFKKRIKTKGFVFSLDALFAIILSSVLIVGSLFFLSQTAQSSSGFSSNYLAGFGRDFLTVMEKTNVLKSSVDSNSTLAIEQFLLTSPNNICVNVSIYSASNDILLSAQLPGCNASDTQIMIPRIFTGSDFTVYYVKEMIWFKES